MKSPDIEGAGQEESYSRYQEDTGHPEEDRHARVTHGCHNKAKIHE